MEYISLENIRNKYPEELSVSQKYTRRGNSIVYSGKSEYSNTINLDFDVSGINTVPNSSFKFIVDIGGSLYTSPDFLNLLQNAQRENNPYFQKKTVPIVKINLGEATTQISDQSTAEKYAEVSVTNNLNFGDTTNKILQHIDWLISDQNEGLRDIKSGGNRVYGDYKLNTSQYNIESDSGLGFEFTDALESGLGETAETKNIVVPDTSTQETSISKRENIQPPPVYIPIKRKTDFDFLSGGRNTGLRQLSDPTGLDRTGLRDAYDTGDFGPLGEIVDNGEFGSFDF